MENTICFMDVEIATNFEGVEFRVTHNQPIGEPITTQLNSNSWLNNCQNSYEVINHKPPAHKP